MPTGPKSANHFTVVERNPSRAGLQLAPAFIGSGSLADLHDGEDTDAGENTSPAVIRTRSCADVQVIDLDLHEERHSCLFGGCRRGIDRLPVRIIYTVAGIGISGRLGVAQDAVRAFLRLGVLPRQAHTVI